jgi:transposase InsO family protein
MKERIKFVLAYEEGAEPIAVLCRRFGISRKTGYKWLKRYAHGGVDGLRDRPSRPGSTPHKTPEQVERIVVAARKKYPYWGPKKLPVIIRQLAPDIDMPAPSTIGEILKRNGLIVPRRRSRGAPPATAPFAQYTEPNEVWCIDFKGDFRVGAKRCYPLTVIDGASRYLVECRGMSRIRTHDARKALHRAFQEFGLPRVIRTDNGPPFASCGAGGLCKLSVWWITLGIVPERIEPGHPEQNGRQERFHRTLKRATATPPARSLSAQQRRFDRFRAEYNELRPHEALGQRPPAEIYAPSPRELPWRRTEPEYAAHVQSYRTSADGSFMWRGRRLRLNSCLDREVVGVEQVDDCHYDVYFGPVRLGRFTKPNSKTKEIKLDTTLEVLPRLPV